MERKIILIKVRNKTLFTVFNPILVEPLELEYLRSICNSKGLNSYIKDDIFDDNENVLIKDGDIFVLTGYNVSENQILIEAEEIKKQHPSSIVIVGGVHVENNSSFFHRDFVDYVIHSHDLRAFDRILDLIMNEGEYFEESPLGYDYRNDDGSWTNGDILIKENYLDILPDRSLLERNINKTRYLDKSSVGLVKGSISCPFNCSFCYCREINQGKYLKADYSKLVTEIKSVPTDYVWIVDDVLFTNKNDALEFIDEMKKVKPNKKIIIYLRADFIIKEEDILEDLIDQGLDEVIIGFEAVTKSELKNYNKGTNPVDYPKVISILNSLNLDYSGLFMVHPDYGIKDFLNLLSFIKENKIDLYTISIFTPLKGTRDFEALKDQLTKTDPKYFDFLHLVIKSKLPKPVFYLFFMIIHLRLLRSKRVWTFIKNNLLGKRNGNN